MSSDVGARGCGTDDDDMATQEQQHAGWRNTYLEHGFHVRHRAHVPVTDVLIEGIGSLQRSEGRAAMWSEQRSRGRGRPPTKTTLRRNRSSSTRGGGARTENMPYMFVTELTSQSSMGLLKASASYSAARDGRPCGVSSDVGGGDEGRVATTTWRRKSSNNTRDGGTRT